MKSDNSFIHISKADEICVRFKANKIISKGKFETVLRGVYDKLSEFIYDEFGYDVEDAIDTEIDDDSYIVKFCFLNGDTIKIECNTEDYKLGVGDEFVINEEIAKKLDNFDKYNVSSFDIDDTFEVYRVIWDSNDSSINYYLRVFITDNSSDLVFNLDDEDFAVSDKEEGIMVDGGEVFLDDSDRYGQTQN